MTKDRARIERLVVTGCRMVVEIIANREGLRGIHGEWVQKGPTVAERTQA